jgi:acetate kinase
VTQGDVESETELNAVRIPVAISARHVHLTSVAIDQLFGPGYVLRTHSALSQPGQFAAEETVTLIGPSGHIPHVRVVGPPRAECQVEVSRSDEFVLGIDAPTRESGHLSGTPGMVLEGPAGQVTLDHGVICALRHIHMTPEDARRLGLRAGQLVQVAVTTGDRELVFGDVIVRVAPDYRLELHLDTDEGNAAGLHSGDQGVLVAKSPSTATLRRPPLS